MLSQFFCFLFNGSPAVLGQISNLCSGSTRDFLNTEILTSIVLPLPPIEEQIKIAALVDDLLFESTRNQNLIHVNIRRSSRLRQSILKQAFTGKLTPQDPNDEPASQLLERIQKEKATEVKPAKGQRKKSDG